MGKEAKHFLSITDVSAEEIGQIFSMASEFKKGARNNGGRSLLKGKTMVMLSEDLPQDWRADLDVAVPRLEARIGFEVAMYQLGGGFTLLGPEEIGLGKRESVGDAAKVLSRMADLIVLRDYSFNTLEELARNSRVPVINAFSALGSPCETLTECFTVWEARGYQATDCPRALELQARNRLHVQKALILHLLKRVISR